MQASLVISGNADAAVGARHVDFADAAAAAAAVMLVAAELVAAELVVAVAVAVAEVQVVYLVVVALQALKPQIGVLETSVRPEGFQEAAS